MGQKLPEMDAAKDVRSHTASLPEAEEIAILKESTHADKIFDLAIRPRP